MSFESQVSYLNFATDGATTVFPLTSADGALYFMDGSHLRAAYVDVDGNVTTLSYGSDFSVSGDGRTGSGALTISPALDADGELRIWCDTDVVQPESYTENDGFPASTHETAQDRGRMIDRDLTRKIARAIHLADSDVLIDMALPPLAGFASKVLALNAEENGFTLVDPYVDRAEAAADAAEGAAANAGADLWSRPVKSILNDPPGVPVTGDRHLVGTVPTGAWIGYGNQIAQWDGAAWIFSGVPGAGQTIAVQSDFIFRRYTGAAWTPLHGSAAFARTVANIATMDAACAAAGVPWYLDFSYTLTGTATYAAKINGVGGIITLGANNCSGDFWAPAHTRMFNINSTGLVSGPAGAEVYAKWFGAAGGVDSTAAIKAAIYFASATGREVRLPSATAASPMIQSGQIVVPSAVRVTGAGSDTTNIVLSGTFTGLTTTGAWRAGNGADQIYGALISNLCLDLNNIAGAIGFYTSDAQDGTGIAHAVFKNVQGKGVWFNGLGGGAGFCNNYICNDVYVAKGRSGGHVGTAFRFDGGTLGSDIDNLTVVVPYGGDDAGANAFDYAYYFKDQAISARSLSIDSGSAVVGVYFDTGCLFAHIAGLTILGDNPTGVQFASSTVPAVIEPYAYLGGGNAIVDAGGGVAAAKTIAGNVLITRYSRGQVEYFNGRLNLMATPGTATDEGVLYVDGDTIKVSPP